MKTTAKHFKIFRNEVIRLYEALGLKDYSLEIEIADLSENTNARLKYDAPAKSALIQIASDRRPEYMTDMEIKKSAKHEIAHLLTADLSHLAICRFLNDGEVDMACEAIARRLEKIL